MGRLNSKLGVILTDELGRFPGLGVVYNLVEVLNP